MIKITKDNRGIHIFMDRARVHSRKTIDARTFHVTVSGKKDGKAFEAMFVPVTATSVAEAKRKALSWLRSNGNFSNVEIGTIVRGGYTDSAHAGDASPHADDCNCPACRKTTMDALDAIIKVPPAKVSKTGSSEQARVIAAKLKAAKDEKPCGCKH